MKVVRRPTDLLREPRYRPLPIADYGLIGDCRSAALVGRNGSIDWLCWPRFDSAACFAALLGDARHGRWRISPPGVDAGVTRSYRGDTLVLETVFDTADGCFALIDFMPAGRPDTSVVRIVEGRRGRLPVCVDLTLRFDYGSTVPWVSRLGGDDRAVVAIAGPDLAVLRSPAPLHGENLATVADFTIEAGQRVPFVLSWGPSHRPPPPPLDAEAALADTIAHWEQWSARCRYRGSRRAPVMRSLLTLKALTFEETGGIVAAPTTSLPEQPGGTRNWDYRFCWLRDATLTLIALMGAGYYDEARAWRDWLHRSVAGSPDDLQIMYGLSGERRLPEWEVGWLPGHRGAAPVRVGNAASTQIQLDVWGEMMDALHLAREGGLAPLPSAWALQCGALRHLERIWDRSDEGIWEVRGGRRQFVHSKVMAWVAFDRMIRDATKYELDAPVAHWCDVRDLIHHTVCEQGWDPVRGSFTQSFGSRELDASLLMIPLTGFLSIDDPRVTATVAAIERELVRDGLVIRYRTESGADGLPPGEGVFLTCSLWLADVYELQGRVLEADALLDRVLSHANDLGLLSEEYDPRSGALVGNFPQALSHMALIRTALGVSEHLPVRSRLESPPTTPDG